ncbi:competence protein ComEA-like protein with helix-hairpin-helix repeat region [Saccharomonospora glauca K62]|uniref:Competence protein ComEA-like protein with helix-hairpin-helix repeat region n=1 Tax=Saccharomonospora glauca K62 TaxID=928724 RepID=I1D035_9PSEU|nr:competence protein ComEA-like protein with helix-hairpin-helix repeat region [Saccharomonospora glauca K62]
MRLAQLAAEVQGRSEHAETAERSSPRHGAPLGETTVAGLVERWRPGARRAVTGRRGRGVIAAAVIGVLGGGVVTAMVLGSAPEPERPPPLPSVRQVSASHSVSPRSSPSTVPTSLVVSVVGTVAEPGLVTVEPGARVADVIELAGGAKRDTDLLTVNLARRVSDGEQIYVGVTPPPGVSPRPSGAEGAPSATGTTGKVDLNSADRELLQTLPGVGEVTAERILEWRERHGGFTSVEQLREVDGIGAKRFARLRDQVTVG